MKSDIPSLVAVAKLLFDLDSDSASPVTLRVKADRRQSLVAFPEALERRLSVSTRFAEVAARLAPHDEGASG